MQISWCSYIYLNIPVSPSPKKSLLQEAIKYLDFFILLPDVISVTMMTSLSKFKQYFEGVNFNPGYASVLTYRIYLSERPGRSFNFEFSKGGAYSREALIEYIKETSKYFQLVS